MLLQIIIGISLAFLLIYLNHLQSFMSPIKLWQNGLWTAAIIYILFATFGEAWTALPLEFIGLLIYGSFVLLSQKYSLYWLVAGWVSHVIWDVFVHHADTTTYVPSWYAGACIGFDLAIAAYILWLIWQKGMLKKSA